MIINYIFGDADGGGRHRGYNPDLAHLIGDIVITSVIAMMMFTLNFFILNPTGKNGKINIYRIFIAVFLTIAAVYILNSLLHPLFHEVRVGRSRGRRDEFDYINFFVAGLVVASTFVIRLVFQKQNIMLENEQLRREALQSQVSGGGGPGMDELNFSWNTFWDVKTTRDEEGWYAFPD